ncbi:MAG: TetR/AcrR family transcriptional regulator [Halioglobus sp.]
MSKYTKPKTITKSKRTPKLKEVAVRTRGQKTRQLILEKSTEILVNKGYDALVLREVALQVGIKLGNLQYYFPTREDLIAEVVAEYHTVQTDEMEELVSSKASPKSKLLTLVNYYLDKWSMRDAFLYMLIIQLGAHNKKIQDAKRKIYQTFYEHLEQIIREVAPGLTPLQCRQKARLITSMMDGIHFQNGFSPGEEDDPSTVFLARELRKQVLDVVGL